MELIKVTDPRSPNYRVYDGCDCRIKINGRWRKANYLGGGCYSNAYRVGNFVYLFTMDRAKAVMADMPRKRHLPIVKSMGEHESGCRIYRMPMYADVTVDHGPLYDLMQRLYRHHLNARDERDMINLVERDKEVPISIKRAVKMLFTHLQEKCGQAWRFDMHSGNYGIHNGELVLRDPICC